MFCGAANRRSHFWLRVPPFSSIYASLTGLYSTHSGLDKSIATTNWEQAVPSPQQITYAALDALVAVLITIKMAETDTVRRSCICVRELVFVLQPSIGKYDTTLRLLIKGGTATMAGWSRISSRRPAGNRQGVALRPGSVQ